MALVSRWLHLANSFLQLNRPVVVVDLETTGGNMLQDRITEIALLRFEAGEVKAYEWLVNPLQPISVFISGLTGITDEMVAGAPTFAEIAEELLPLLRGALVVAHNSRFDYTFLCHEFRRAGLDFGTAAVCTVQLSRSLYPEFFKHNLDSIIERFGIEADSRHRAMTDVLALVDFMELSLKEKGREIWLKQFAALMNPKALPVGLPSKLAAQLEALSDGVGVLVWLDREDRALAVRAHERAYMETAAMLNGKNRPGFIESADSVRFVPAYGRLHAVWLKAQLMDEYGLRPSENPGRYFTVRFVADEYRRLQARIVGLANGCFTFPPNGLFLHKKSAKSALLEWARCYGLCPQSLNILPSGHGEGNVCPVSELGQCDGLCRTAQRVDELNVKIQDNAGHLPVADWGRAHELEIVEQDAVSGREVVLLCKGGALALPGGRWYFDDELPGILKAKLKKGQAEVKVVF